MTTLGLPGEVTTRRRTRRQRLRRRSACGRDGEPLPRQETGWKVEMEAGEERGYTMGKQSEEQMQEQEQGLGRRPKTQW
jgi:hypothetical protein